MARNGEVGTLRRLGLRALAWESVTAVLTPSALHGALRVQNLGEGQENTLSERQSPDLARVIPVINGGDVASEQRPRRLMRSIRGREL